MMGKRNIRRNLHLLKGLVKRVDSYKYLAVIITSKGTSETEIKAIIKQGK